MLDYIIKSVETNWLAVLLAVICFCMNTFIPYAITKKDKKYLSRKYINLNQVGAVAIYVIVRDGEFVKEVVAIIAVASWAVLSAFYMWVNSKVQALSIKKGDVEVKLDKQDGGDDGD